MKETEQLFRTAKGRVQSVFAAPATAEQLALIVELGGRPTRRALTECQARRAISELRHRARTREYHQRLAA